ncbi:MAG TPA: hypothetical protein VGN63_17495 [Flavisolibacter sp.]|jgi:hypothetical protein|nr:hypothetical protein [Flavisolibacter sp.]
MNRFIQSTEGTVLFRMSNNAEYYSEGMGVFEVRFQRQRSRRFPTLLEAFLFYYTVEEEAELWDQTYGPVMIESKIKISLN